MIKKFEIPVCEMCAIRDQSLFCMLTHQELDDITLHKSCNLYKSGQYVFIEGGYASGLYCVNKGIIKLFKLGADGNEQIIRLAKAGDVLGYRALISGEPYFGTAETIGESIICFIPKEKFFELLTTRPDITQQILKKLSKDLKSAEKKIMTNGHKPVRERLAEALFMFKEFFGMEEDGETINSTLKREDIANIIGTATETVIRILSDFKEEKLIELNGKKIIIKRPDVLMNIANLDD